MNPILRHFPETLEQMLVRPVGFRSTTTRTPTGWRVTM